MSFSNTKNRCRFKITLFYCKGMNIGIWSCLTTGSKFFLLRNARWGMTKIKQMDSHYVSWPDFNIESNVLVSVIGHEPLTIWLNISTVAWNFSWESLHLDYAGSWVFPYQNVVTVLILIRNYFHVLASCNEVCWLKVDCTRFAAVQNLSVMLRLHVDRWEIRQWLPLRRFWYHCFKNKSQ